MSLDPPACSVPGQLEVSGTGFDADFHEVQEEAYDAIESDLLSHVARFAWQPGQAVAVRLYIATSPTPIDEVFQCTPAVFSAESYHRHGRGATHALASYYLPCEEGKGWPCVQLYFAWDGTELDMVRAIYVRYNGGS